MAVQINFSETFAMFHEAELGPLVKQRKHSNKLCRIYLGSREAALSFQSLVFFSHNF